MDPSSPVSIARSFVRRRNECLLCERNYISYSFTLVFLKFCMSWSEDMHVVWTFFFLTHIRLASFYGGI